MSGGKLEVQIGADISDLRKSIDAAEKELGRLRVLKNKQIRLGLDTSDTVSKIGELETKIKSLTNKYDGLNKSAKNISDTAKNVTANVSKITGVSDVASDGLSDLVGVAVEAFGDLKQSTSSGSVSLKSFLGALSGSVLTGGISLLTTGLTYLAQSGLSVSDVIDKINGKFDEFGASLNKISVDAAKTSAQEIANVRALVSVAQDEVKSRKERLIAVEELQSKYPAYFGNLSKEKILNGDLTGVTKELTKAIVARAEATALADKIGELASKKLDLEIQREKALLKLKKAQAALDNKVTVTGGTVAGTTGLSAEGRLASATSTVRDLNKEIAEIQDQQNKLAQKLNDKTSESISLLEKKAGAEKKTFATPQVSAIQQTIVPAPVFDTLGIATFNGQVDKFGNKIKELPNTIKASMLTAREAIRTGNEEIAIALGELNARASQIISGAIAETFAGIGFAIGDAIANGGSVLESVGVALLVSLGGLLIEMGKMAIQIGVSLLAIKTALKSLNPAVAIAAGVALVALGSFFSSKSKSIGNSIGGGGGVSGGSGSGANNNSFTSSSFSSRGSDGGTVVFEIAGQKLVGVLSNTLNANRRLGGQLGLG